MQRLRQLDWEAIAGITAATVALVLHLLHIAEEGVLLAVILVILALLMLRDLRRESRDEEELNAVRRMSGTLADLRSTVGGPEVTLVGPRQLRTESERFASEAHGHMVWFNVCLSMFEPQELFDVLLRPALENEQVTSVQFVLKPSEKRRWESVVLPRAARTMGSAKLAVPRWVDLDENISFILARDEAGRTEAHVSFWGEPFMAHRRGQDIPRYVLRVHANSSLIASLEDLERGYRARAREE